MADSQKRSGENGEEEPPLKRTCVRSSEDPDVTIVVGGVEFHEYRQVLRCISGYFDAAFKSGMKEAQTSRFEFPDKDPKEWEEVMSVLLPGGKARATVDNIDLVFRWCDELSIMNPPAHCDFILKEKVCEIFKTLKLENEVYWYQTKESIRPNQFLLLDWLERSNHFHLVSSKEFLVKSLDIFMDYVPNEFSLSWIEQAVRMVKGNVKGMKELWKALERQLPDSLKKKEKPIVELLDMELLPELLHSQMEKTGMKAGAIAPDPYQFRIKWKALLSQI